MTEKGNFSKDTQLLVRRIQKERCYLAPDLLLEIFHHEPPKRELVAVGIVPGDFRYALGLSLPGHAAIHSVRFNLFGNGGDRDARDSVIHFLDNTELEIVDDLIFGKEKGRIERLIVNRRKKYLGK
ncbi:MAG TPA: hypothetical protein VN174_04665 [Candidatus Methanoperedens sp.]|nr:hypothetical protein [Candidatus Methanoperedens sp.]